MSRHTSQVRRDLNYMSKKNKEYEELILHRWINNNKEVIRKLYNITILGSEISLPKPFTVLSEGLSLSLIHI